MSNTFYIGSEENEGLAETARQLVEDEWIFDRIEFGGMRISTYDNKAHIIEYSPDRTEYASNLLAAIDHLRVVVQLVDADKLVPEISGYLSQDQATVFERLGFTAARTMLTHHPVFRDPLGDSKYQVNGQVESIRAALLPHLAPSDRRGQSSTDRLRLINDHKLGLIDDDDGRY